MLTEVNAMSRNTGCTIVALVLLINSRCESTTLQFSSSNDRPMALYRAPAPYQEAGKARLNSVIITSRPFAVGEQYNLTDSRSQATTTTTQTPFWRRQLFVSSSTTTPNPREHTEIPHYTIECSKGKLCSETITIQSTPAPTFKPYSKDVLEKFLSDYAATHKSNSIKPYTNYVTPKSVVKISSSTEKRNGGNKDSKEQLSDVDNPTDATNRLATLYLGDEEDEETLSLDGKSPQWSLINAQHHNHPYDDRDGWVTLEAVPWSASKISKWQSHNSGNKGHWADFHKPTELFNKPIGQDFNRPTTPHDWELEKPIHIKPLSENPHYPEKPEWLKPIKPQFLIGNRPVEYKPSEPTHKPVYHVDRPSGDYDYKPSPGHHSHHQQWVTSGHPDIITDNSPENWPVNRPVGSGSYKPQWTTPTEPEYSQHHHSNLPNRYENEYKYETPNRRPPTPVVYHDMPTQNQKPHNHPDNGDGEWVLLSSTKGYSLPIRHHSYQRAMTLNPKPLTSTKSVKLTVLPALNGTANTTTSHGGILEVESTFQSVDEAQQYDEMKKIGNYNSSGIIIPVQYDPVANNSVKKPVRLVSRPIPNRKGSGRAVLAAVGAGMLPATMALLVPMMLGRKKRSIPKSSVNSWTLPALVSGHTDGQSSRLIKGVKVRKNFRKRFL